MRTLDVWEYVVAVGGSDVFVMETSRQRGVGRGYRNEVQSYTGVARGWMNETTTGWSETKTKYCISYSLTFSKKKDEDVELEILRNR